MSLTAPRRFTTTRWSLVIAASGDPASGEARGALAELCEAYWFPVFAFIRRTGKSNEDARDLTQAFFARVLEKRAFAQATQERGRFRSFLLASVRHFLANEYDHDRAVKRGGGRLPLPIELPDDEGSRFVQEPADTVTPDQVYERNWAQAVIRRALARLEQAQTGDARRETFRHLKPLLTGGEPASYADLARTLHTTEGALRVTVHRLRRQWGDQLREVVAETVESPAAVDDELRHLLVVAAG
jgi:RNA polymerase sigma factor (sigma-70 family)